METENEVRMKMGNFNLQDIHSWFGTWYSWVSSVHYITETYVLPYAFDNADWIILITKNRDEDYKMKSSNSKKKEQWRSNT